MRPSLVVAALLAAAAPLPANAAGCVASADPPMTVGGQVFGTGRFNCVAPGSGMTVTVCIEALRPAARGWVTTACVTESAPTPVTMVEGTAWWCVYEALLVRTAVSASNAAGDAATATSLPSLPGTGSCGP